jgi:hypothetical protein
VWFRAEGPGPARQLRETLAQQPLAAGRDQGLEVSPAGGPVADERVVAVAEPARQESPRRGRRQLRQESAGRGEAEVADPSAAGAHVPSGTVQVGRERRVWIVSHRCGAGGDDVAAARPGAEQGDRVRVAAGKLQRRWRSSPTRADGRRPGPAGMPRAPSRHADRARPHAWPVTRTRLFACRPGAPGSRCATGRRARVPGIRYHGRAGSRGLPSWHG